MLPSPMLARADSTLPVGDYGFEVKWDGFRAIVSTEDGFRVRSRRGWNMAPLISEIAREDVRGVFDGELVAFREGVPHFPNVTARMLHRRREIPVAFAVFDVLALDSEPTTSLPYAERRELLESLELGGGFWFLPPVFDDGPSLFAAVCEQGLERLVLPLTRVALSIQEERNGGRDSPRRRQPDAQECEQHDFPRHHCSRHVGCRRRRGQGNFWGRPEVASRTAAAVREGL